MKKDHYEVLGIPNDSGPDIIRRGYLDKVRMVHPDINPSADAHKEFILLKEAYDVLMDENKRMIYDMKIKQAATTKRNVENFHYDFKSNLTRAGNFKKEMRTDISVAIIKFILIAIAIALLTYLFGL